MTTNLRATFDREVDAIRGNLVKMSQMVDAALEKSIQALVEGDVTLAEQVIANDEEINQLRFTLEESCFVLIATQQPAASDLRAVIAVIHMAVEMERMADHAAGIAKTVVLMKEEPLLKTFKKIPKMAEMSRRMLSDCIQAFLKRDAAWAQEIAAQDEEMDRLYHDVFEKLVQTMAKKPELITRATYLMWCAHNLERIADRVTNIAERIIFINTGDFRELNVKVVEKKES